MYDSKLREAALVLRKKHRFSLKAVAEVFGVSLSTASLWLRGTTLTSKEVKERRGKSSASRRKSRGERSKFFSAFLERSAELTRSERGRIAEAAVCFRLLLRGYEVFVPLGDGSRVDLVARDRVSGKAYRIQVKWVHQNSSGGLPNVRLGSAGTRYEEQDFDFIVGYDVFSDTAYVFAQEDVASLKSSVAISEESAERWDKLAAIV